MHDNLPKSLTVCYLMISKPVFTTSVTRFYEKTHNKPLCILGNLFFRYFKDERGSYYFFYENGNMECFLIQVTYYAKVIRFSEICFD